MTNLQLTVLTVVALAAHLAAMGAALLLKRGPGPVAGLNLAVAAMAIIYFAIHPRWLQVPVDWPVAGLALFEVLVLAAAVLALRGAGLGVGVSWAAFAVHLLISAAAVAFVLTFKINRLI